MCTYIYIYVYIYALDSSAALRAASNLSIIMISGSDHSVRRRYCRGRRHRYGCHYPHHHRQYPHQRCRRPPPLRGSHRRPLHHYDEGFLIITVNVMVIALVIIIFITTFTIIIIMVTIAVLILILTVIIIMSLRWHGFL